jgi:hypothetical protein
MMGLSGLRVKDVNEASSAIASHCAFRNFPSVHVYNATTSLPRLYIDPLQAPPLS